MTASTHDIANTELTFDQLSERVMEAKAFHESFSNSAQCDEQGLRVNRAPEWATKLIRRSESVAHAVLAKLGANTIAKRRPQQTQAFLDYITRCYEARATLNIRVVFGPVKNVQRFGAYQQADMAEYLTLMQLARVSETIATIYPHGVRVQMVPDDKRGGEANAWPAAYSSMYVASLKRMVQELEFDAWLNVEDGQARLYEEYRVQSFKREAIIDVMTDEYFTTKLEMARHHARENLFSDGNEDVSDHAVQASAIRYLVAHKAEILSGMWSPVNALPLMYANHPGNYQLYTMGRGLTKLPWQIRLPFTLLTTPETHATSMHAIQFAKAV